MFLDVAVTHADAEVASALEQLADAVAL
jgi:hypothetical protein